MDIRVKLFSFLDADAVPKRSVLEATLDAADGPTPFMCSATGRLNADARTDATCTAGVARLNDAVTEFSKHGSLSCITTTPTTTPTSSTTTSASTTSTSSPMMWSTKWCESSWWTSWWTSLC